MSDFGISLESEVFRYHVSGVCVIKFGGVVHEIETYVIEHDPNHPERYACQIVTTEGVPLIFEGVQRGSWPPVIRRLFEKHTKRLRLLGIGL